MPSRTEILHEAEWRKCRADALYFLETYWHIRTPSGRVLFQLRPEQKSALGVWLAERYVINLKARQIGWTTLSAGYAFWKAFFFSDQAIVFLSRGEREAANILRMVDYGWRFLPEWMKARGPKRQSFAQTKMPFDNDSEIESLPSKEDPARGKTVTLVIVDEWAFFDDPENAWASIEPITDVGGQVIGLSTANGWGNFFHSLWVRAETGNSSFVPLFFPWSAVPGRDEAWYAQKQRDLMEWQLHQEYPSTPEEAFIKSGNVVFDVDRLRKVETEEPVRGWLIGGPDFVRFEEGAGPLAVYERPELGDGYVIGADTAEGLEHGDFSSAHVISLRTGKVVAHWHGHVDPDLFGEDVLYNLGMFYLRALVGVEANNHGLVTLLALKRAGYTNIYHRWVEDERAKRQTKKMGWYTSRSTKPILIDTLVKSLREDLVLRDKFTIAELLTFVRNERGQMSGSPFDDRVMSLAIANKMREYGHVSEYALERDDYWTLNWWRRQGEDEAGAPRVPIGASNVRSSVR